MSEELVKKLVQDKEKWKIATQTYTGSIAGYDIFVGQAMDKKKWIELHDNLWGEGAKMTWPMFKKNFNLPCENAIDASNLGGFITLITQGPEWEWETVEESPKKVVVRYHKCPWWNRYTEFGLKPEDMICPGGHINVTSKGIKAVNPKIKCTLTKAMPWGDDYCEDIWEMEE
jgi:hypothetical protein